MDGLGIENLLAVVAAFLVVTVSPGPANLAAAAVALRHGRRPGLIFGAGLATGLAFWGVVAATGMGQVLAASETALIALKLFGGLYLLWLAFQSALAARAAARAAGYTPDVHAETVQAAVPEPDAAGGGGRWFLGGLTLNLSNPKAVFAWMAALAMGLGGTADAGFVATATALCMALGFANYALHALVFSLAHMTAAYRRAARGINAAVAGLFALAGLGLLRSAFTR